MTRFNHSICLFFGLALALLAGAALMLMFDRGWRPDNIATLIVTALALALLVPTAAAIGSRYVIRRGQPATAWLVFYATALLLAGLGWLGR